MSHETKHVSVKFRIYPSVEQEDKLKRTIGCCRFVYNHYLSLRRGQYESYLSWQTANSGKDKSKYKWPKLPTESELKRKFTWLKDVDAASVQQSRIDLTTAFSRFFKGHARYPVFHKKNEKNSFRLVQGIRVSPENKQLRLSVVGFIKAKGSFNLIPKGKVKFITVSLDAGDWYASCTYEVSYEEWLKPTEHYLGESCGIDLGVKRPLTITDGYEFYLAGKTAQKRLRGLEKHRSRVQRCLARKRKGSNNRIKTRNRLQKIYQKERFCRNEFIEQTSNTLTDAFRVIVFENLNLKAMTEKGTGHKASMNREMLRLGFSKLITRCQTKAARRGGDVLLVNPSYTSQTCSDCGSIDKKSRKSQSRFECTSCGLKLNADKNAALNILAKA